MPLTPDEENELAELNRLAAPKKSTSVGEAVGRAVEEGASLGLAKRGRAAGGGLYSALNPEPEEANTPFAQRFIQAHAKELASEEKDIARIKKDRPYTFGITKGLAGLIPSAPAFVTGPAGVVLTGAATGNIESLAEGKNPLVGTVAGAGGALLGLGLAKGMSALAGPLKKAATEGIRKAIKFAPTTLRRLKSVGNVFGKADEIADDMVKAGIADNPVTMKTLYNKTASTLKETGSGLGALYGEADQALKGGAMGHGELVDVMESAVAKNHQYANPEDVAGFVKGALGNIPSKYGKKSVSELIYGTPDKKLSTQEVWDYVKNLDDLSRQWERSSDAAFASKADQLATAASGIRKALINKIESAAPELAKDISKLSSLYRNLSMAEGALSDQLIRGSSQNRSIPRTTLTEAVGSLMPGTPVRLGMSKAERGLAQTLEALSPFGVPTGIMIGKDIRGRFQ